MFLLDQHKPQKSRSQPGRVSFISCIHHIKLLSSFLHSFWVNVVNNVCIALRTKDKYTKITKKRNKCIGNRHFLNVYSWVVRTFNLHFKKISVFAKFFHHVFYLRSDCRALWRLPIDIVSWAVTDVIGELKHVNDRPGLASIQRKRGINAPIKPFPIQLFCSASVTIDKSGALIPDILASDAFDILQVWQCYHTTMLVANWLRTINSLILLPYYSWWNLFPKCIANLRDKKLAKMDKLRRKGDIQGVSKSPLKIYCDFKCKYIRWF